MKTIVLPMLCIIVLLGCGETSTEPQKKVETNNVSPQIELPPPIDVNGDGIADYKFESEVIGTDDEPQSSRSIIITLRPIDHKTENSLLYLKKQGFLPCDSGFVIKVNPVDSSMWSFYDGDLYNIGWGIETGWDTTWSGSWAGASKKYLPIKFYIGNSIHTGWLCMSVDKKTGKLTLHDFGYQQVPNADFTTGNK